MLKPERFNRLLLFFIAVCGVAADQATKYSVFSWLSSEPQNRYVLFRTTPKDDLELHGFALAVQFERSDDAERSPLTYGDGSPIPHVNHGALFGFLRDHKTAANMLFAAISCGAIVFVLWWSSQLANVRDRWFCIALGFILAGTVGNLYDRLVFNGVRDFLHWDYLYDWPVFNVADCCLVTGACMLLLQVFATPAKKPSAESSPVQAERAPAASQPVLATANAVRN
jgi:lipoprotein signal peptidase